MTASIHLGDFTPDTFMQHIWQKKPLMVRQALPNHQPLINVEELKALAHQLPTRFLRTQPKWRLTYQLPKKLPSEKEPWTFLVQHVNTKHAGIAQFMQKFAFMGYTQLDDVMISYATAGAGIGAHVDSYDVFLFQGMGRRTWQVTKNFDPTLQEDLPIKVLKYFDAEQTYVLEEGDMLYLPAGWAHQGIADTAGMTYSVGFRAPKAHELLMEYAIQHLDQLEDMVAKPALQTLYQYQAQQACAEPAKIGPRLVEFLQNQLAQLPPTSFSHVLGKYFSATHIPHLAELIEPMVDDEPDAPLLKMAAFKEVQAYACALQYPILYDDAHFFVDGEAFGQTDFSAEDCAKLKILANEKTLTAKGLSKALYAFLYDWYECGYIYLL